MNTPTLKEVKKHFENAQIIQCAFFPKDICNINDMDKIDKLKGIYQENQHYWLEHCGGLNAIILWDAKSKQYAKILETKTKT